MHILFDARPLQSASATRGIGRYAFEVLHALAARGSSLTFTFLLAPDRPPPRLPEPIAGALLAYPARIPEQLRGFADAALLPRLIASTPADVYYSPEYGLPRRSRIPVVVTVHDVIPWVVAHHTYARQRIRWSVQRRLLRRASRLLCDSNATRSALVARLAVDPARTRVAYPGVSPLFFGDPAPSDLASLDRRFGRGFALFVGACDWRKRPEHAIAAIAGTDAHLLVVGPNERQAARLRALGVRSGANGRVHLGGALSDGELLAAYRLAAVLLFPSRYEGFGLPLLEAQAARLPAVAYANSSIPEAVGAGAGLVPDGDLDEFVRRARAALTGSLDGWNADADRERARQFTWEKTADRLLQACQEVA